MDDKRLRTIRALLAKAERTNHLEEAKTYTAKAEELMTKWAIDEAMLAGMEDAQTIEVLSIRLEMGVPPYQGAKENLISAIAYAHDCRVVLSTGTKWENGKRTRPTFAVVWGFKRELEFVEMLYTSCLLQIEHALTTDETQAIMRLEAPKPGNRIKWRNVFTKAYAAAIGHRLRQMRRSVVDATPGAGLVLANAKGRVDDAVSDAYSKLKSAKRTGADSYGSATLEGGKAGRNADLGAGRRMSSAPRQLP